MSVRDGCRVRLFAKSRGSVSGNLPLTGTTILVKFDASRVYETETVKKGRDEIKSEQDYVTFSR
jgi:hypothetical protein